MSLTRPDPPNHFDDKIRLLFNSSSDEYASLFSDSARGANHSFRKRLALALKMSSGINGSLLDFACGPGHITRAIIRSGGFHRATLVDISPEMLNKARSNLVHDEVSGHPAEVDFVLANAFDFEQEPGVQFDLILILGLIAHTGRLDELLAKSKRMLAPNGGILLQSTLVDHLGTKIVRLVTRKRHFRKLGYWSNYYSLNDIRDSCARNGMEVHSLERFCVGIPFGDRIWRRANFCIESRCEQWAEHNGSEALFLIKSTAELSKNPRGKPRGI